MVMAVMRMERRLRRICLELRPPLLDELGLEEALYWLAQRSEQRDKTHGNDLHVNVVCRGASCPGAPLMQHGALLE
jgi:signal transduction histidine kinase